MYCLPSPDMSMLLGKACDGQMEGLLRRVWGAWGVGQLPFIPSCRQSAMCCPGKPKAASHTALYHGLTHACQHAHAV